MRISLLSALTCAALVASPAMAAETFPSTGQGDLVPQALTRLPTVPGDGERKPVSFSWALDPAAPLFATPPHLAQSTEYWQTVDAGQLQAGVSLPITSQGALIRVSPARNAKALAPAQLQMRLNGNAVDFDAGADADALRAAGMEVSAGTRILRLDQTGAGRYTLQAPDAQGQYVVHVFEPNSDLVLSARAERDVVLAGASMRVDIAAARSGQPLPATAEALLVSPGGNTWPVPVERAADGQLFAQLQAPTLVGNEAGLWELQVFTVSDGVPRDVRTAFAVAPGTARFAGVFATDAKRLRVALPVQAASEGRYEARGTLYATSAAGELRPVSLAHSAAWLKRGNGMLVLVFDPSHLPHGYGAPFEVRELQLNDQTRMAPLEQRQAALRF